MPPFTPLPMVDAEFLGKKLTSSTGTPAYTTDRQWRSSQGSVKLATSLSGLGAASVVGFHRLSLEIETGLYTHQAFGADTLSDNFNGPLKITGELSILRTANTYRDYVTGGSERAMRISFAGDSIGNAETCEVQINLAKCAFQEWEVTEANDDIVIETVKFVAQYDQDEGSPQMINVVVTNENAGASY